MTINFFIIHGTVLWITWGVFALVQISSNRYMKGSQWDSYLWVHRIVGGMLVILTLFYALYAWGTVGW